MRKVGKKQWNSEPAWYKADHNRWGRGESVTGYMGRVDTRLGQLYNGVDDLLDLPVALLGQSR